jgi:hypothetical protein
MIGYDDENEPECENEPEIVDEVTHRCTDCDILTEALRDLEQQCREAEDERNREIVLCASKKLSQLLREPVASGRGFLRRPDEKART